jgi:hypothetical protein
MTPTDKRKRDSAAHQYIQREYLPRLDDWRSPVDEVDVAFKAGYDAGYAEHAARPLINERLIAVTQERDRLRAALERIATTRCAWPLSQEIAREALKRD